MTLTIGRLTFDDSDVDRYDGETLELSGMLVGEAARLHRQLANLRSHIVPVRWHTDGWWRLTDVEIDRVAYQTGWEAVRWAASLARIGTSAEVEWESRLVGALRANDHLLTGERWHAPVPGHRAWWADTSAPGTVERTSTDGPVTVYRTLASTDDPIWQVDPDLWYDAAVTVEVDGHPVSGTDVQPGADWRLTNGLVAIQPSGADLRVTSYDGTWDTVDWTVDVDATDVTGWLPPQILRNLPHVATLRLVADTTGPGRTVLDLTLLRGSRTVAGRLQHNDSATLKVERSTVEAATAFTGGIYASTASAAGHRWVLASADSHTADTVNGAISAAAVTSLDLAVGHEIDGGTAQAGDTAADLLNQHLGAPAETIRPVRR